jgi:hypothetical protein
MPTVLRPEFMGVLAVVGIRGLHAWRKKETIRGAEEAWAAVSL